MQKTPNLKFNKIELTDSPPDITINNPNWDIIDEKLFNIIQAWEDFKNNGGAIGGSLKINGSISGNDGGFFSQIEKDKQFYIDLKEVDGFIIEKHSTLNQMVVRSKFGAYLGTITNPFAELFLGSYSKNTNGYTKLPNGFILQWGRMIRTGTESKSWELYPNFPIEFPNACWTVVGNISSQDSNTNSRLLAGYIVPLTKQKFKTRGGAIGLPYEGDIATTEINWIAIGY